MPCFDKKLEASREELTDTAWEMGLDGNRGTRDVDCVITSKELLMLADSRGIDFSSLPRSPVSSTNILIFPDETLGRFLFPKGPSRKQSTPAAGTSGGNLYYILQSFSSQNPGSSIQTIRGRNADVMEYVVMSASGEPLLKAARYYGFRNIQNLVRRLKPAKPSRMPGARAAGAARKPGPKSSGSEYAYVEVMACPGGCTNGGGQIKLDGAIMSGRRSGEAKPGPQEQKEWLKLVDEAYFSGDDEQESSGSDAMDAECRNDMVDGISPSYIKSILRHWSDTTGIDLDRLVYTGYRAVVSDVGKKVGDTERVVELAGKIGGGW